MRLLMAAYRKYRRRTDAAIRSIAYVRARKVCGGMGRYEVRYHGKTDNQNPSRADTDCGSGDYAVSHCE